MRRSRAQSSSISQKLQLIVIIISLDLDPVQVGPVHLLHLLHGLVPARDEHEPRARVRVREQGAPQPEGAVGQDQVLAQGQQGQVRAGSGVQSLWRENS